MDIIFTCSTHQDSQETQRPYICKLSNKVVKINWLRNSFFKDYICLHISFHLEICKDGNVLQMSSHTWFKGCSHEKSILGLYFKWMIYKGKSYMIAHKRIHWDFGLGTLSFVASLPSILLNDLTKSYFFPFQWLNMLYWPSSNLLVRVWILVWVHGFGKLFFGACPYVKYVNIIYAEWEKWTATKGNQSF